MPANDLNTIDRNAAITREVTCRATVLDAAVALTNDEWFQIGVVFSLLAPNTPTRGTIAGKIGTLAGTVIALRRTVK